MKLIKEFNRFTYKPLLENLENSQPKDKINIGGYQRMLQKFYKDSDLSLYYTSKYDTVTLVLISLFDKIFSNITLDESLMLCIFSISVLSKESKDKVEKLSKYLSEHGIDPSETDLGITLLENVYELFKAILTVSGEDISTFENMLSNTSILVPFISVIKSLIDNNNINLDLLSQPLKDIKIELGESGFKMLIHRILHKLNIMTTSTNKFQNKDNVKPLRVNDELKGPLYQSENVILEGNIFDETEDVKGKIERSKTLSKEMKEKILPLISIRGIHGTRYNKSKVYELTKPKVEGKSFKGVGLGADKDGFFVMTHRARSKSYPELSDIPNKDITFIESTG